jgi:glycosyltransferase involved in cell wall biosynthesis
VNVDESSGPVRIVHLAASDCEGGAFRAAYRLHLGLKSLGQDSRMFVASKASHDPTVTQFVPPTSSLSRFSRVAKRMRISRDLRKSRDLSVADGSLFSDDRSTYLAGTWNQCPAADVLNLHWVSGFLDYSSFFRWLPENKALVWTLHDMNPFTGGCHYNGGCDKFAAQCGACPQLGSANNNDLSRQIWRRKQESLARLRPERLHIVTPSRWLGEEAKRSSLFRRFPRSVIPYGLDTGVFQPRDRRLMREALGIPPQAKVMLFSARAVSDPRKGLDWLERSLEGSAAGLQLFLLSLGAGGVTKATGIPHRHVDTILDDGLLACMYSAADLFVAPSLEDNLPNTVLESLACGTPVVAFATGGIPDAVRNGETGLTVPVGDAGALQKAIIGLLGNDALRAEMSGKCRSVALAEYDLKVQAQRYVNLYGEIASKAADGKAK